MPAYSTCMNSHNDRYRYSTYPPHTTRYGLVEQIDSQLRRIGQDLRDVIDQMNTTAATTTNDGSTEVCVVWGTLTMYSECMRYLILLLCVLYTLIGNCV